VTKEYGGDNTGDTHGYQDIDTEKTAFAGGNTLRIDCQEEEEKEVAGLT
jgi:hypothetical protein